MSKRKPTSELTDRNWDDEEEPEEAGTFQLADQDVLKTRTIRRARRTMNTASGGSSSGGLFAGFALKTSDSSNPKPSLSTGVTNNFGAALTFQSKSNGASQSQIAATASSPKASNNGSSTDNPEYLRQLKLLNENILSWIQKHVSENPYCILTPSFKDYEKHLGNLERKYAVQESKQDVTESKTVPATAPSPAPAPAPEKPAASVSVFGGTNKAFGAGTGFSFAPSSASSFGAAAAASSESKTLDSSDGAEKKVSGLTGTSGFTFGAGLTSGGFGSSESKPFSFSFGAGPQKPAEPAATTSAPASSGATGEDEEYVPPKAEVREIKEEGAVYTKRCKLFYQKDGQWVDRGVGNIHIKLTEGGKTQLIVRADTNLGNILLNILLTSAIPTKRQGKNNVFFVCVPNPQISKETTNEPTPMLLRVKTAEDADELLAKMEEMKA